MTETFQYVPWRGLSRSTMEFYDIKTRVLDDTPTEVHLKWPNGRTLSRSRVAKEFKWFGEKTGKGALFGMERFPPGSARAITITEGALDAASVFQMMGSKYPAVAISSAQAGRKECAEEFDYLNSFEKIYLCLDTDGPGQKAATEIAALFDFNKIYQPKMTLKDANQYLTEDPPRPDEFVKVWWGAKRFLPEDVISSFSEIDEILDNDALKESIPYPFDILTSQTYGIRTGEINLITAQEGIGKTEIIRAIEYHVLKTTDSNIAVIHLEEGKSRIIKGFAGYELKTPVHLPDTNVSKEEIKKAYRIAAGRDERIHIYTHFGSDDPDVLLDTIRFLVGACGCKYVFFDHITMVVTGLQDDDERKTLDYLSTKLAMMVEDMDFCLFLVSHVNDEGKTRGSRNISKVADLHIDLFRNVQSEILEERNTTYLTIKKNRFCGKTGPSGVLRFDPETYTLQEELALPI